MGSRPIFLTPTEEREICNTLCDKGIQQEKIANLLNRSQSWVSKTYSNYRAETTSNQLDRPAVIFMKDKRST